MVKKLSLFSELTGIKVEESWSAVTEAQEFNREFGRLHGFVIKHGTTIKEESKGVKSIIEVIWSVPLGGLVPISFFKEGADRSIGVNRNETELKYFCTTPVKFDYFASLYFGGRIFQDPETHKDPTALTIRYLPKVKNGKALVMESKWELEVVPAFPDRGHIVSPYNTLSELDCKLVRDLNTAHTLDGNKHLVDIVKSAANGIEGE